MADLKPRLKKSTSESEVEDKATEQVFQEHDGETVYEMLAGYKDEKGDIYKEFTFREMTGKDEEAVSRPEIRQNGSKAINVILERCVLSIGPYTRANTPADKWKRIVQSLLSPDQDYIIVKIREESVGGEIEVSHTCPNCNNKMDSVIDLEELEVEPFNGEWETPFELPRGYKDKKGVVHREGVIRLPNGVDREILTPLASKNLSKANTLMLTRLCKFNDGYVITEDVMPDLVLKDREYLQSLLHDKFFGVKTVIELTCTDCGHNFSGNLNTTNFM
jgi:hypothetical protein